LRESRHPHLSQTQLHLGPQSSCPIWRSVDLRFAARAARFLALALAGFALNNVVLLGVTHQGVPAALGLLLSGVASPALSYIGSRQLVFAQKKRLAECSEPLSQSKSKDKPTEAGLRRMLTLRG
jgi:hypothetical protein